MPRKPHPHPGEPRYPELRRPADPIAEAGKRLRDRLSALRPTTDVKR